MPAVDRQRQRAAHPGIVKRLFLVVRGYQIAAIPVALLHRDFAVERALEFVARRRRKAAELDRGAVGAYRVEPHRLLVGIDRRKAVKIRQSFAIIIGIADPSDRLASLVFGEFEGAGTEDVLLVPARVLVEDFLLVDERERVGERRQKSVGREFKMENNGG